jgi:hypothetical protein
MDVAPQPSPPSTIPWRLTWIVLSCSLAVPWVLRLFPSASPQHGDMTFFVLLVCWTFLSAVWWGCLLALAVRRAELLGLMTFFAVLVWFNVFLLFNSFGIHNRVQMGGLFGALLLSQLISFIVTFFLRLDSTLAHAVELPRVDEQKPVQFTLRALLVVTAVLSVIAALISTAAHEGRLKELAVTIPWLLLINMAVIWNELLQPRLRVWWFVVGSFVWSGLWGLASFTNRAEISFFAFTTLSAFVYAIPVTWRWAGWRIAPRLLFLPEGTNL